MTRMIVVIVNWQRPADTIECIQSLRVAGVPTGDILLVDNGSQDSSVEIILADHPGIMVDRLPRNLGFAGGYNRGIEIALTTDASHVFLLNNDTTVDSQAINMLMASGWDVAIPKILFYNEPKKVWSAGAHWRFFPPAVIMNGYLKPDGPDYDRPATLAYATGCALLCKREVLVDVGGFDQEFENYMEDYDLFFRIQKTDYKIGYVPDARIFHKVSQTLGHESPHRYFFLGRNTVLFYRKDQRFPALMLWSYLGWYIVREIIKGNSRCLPGFLRGVREGFTYLKSLEKTTHGPRVL